MISFSPRNIIFLLLFAASFVRAEALSPEQAKQVAARFLAEKSESSALSGTPRKAPKLSEMRTAVVFDATDPAGQPYIYAVSLSDQDGCVLVSGDDRFADVLAYTDSYDFNLQSMPERMRAWLQQYIDEMTYLHSVDYQPVSLLVATPKEAISPMVTTLWDQGAPYSNLCPVDPTTTDTRCVTGCVATDMAQIINYHMQRYNAPTAIASEIEAYTTKGRGIAMPATPAGTPLPDRTLLINSYKGNGITDAQKNAVAQLMLYCGTAVGMDYYASSSSSSTSRIPAALIKYFGFDSTSRIVNRSDYTYAAWCDLIYSELAAARPVCYGGQSSGGGHSFVIDGYDGDGLFHVNWGWSGSSNGYFALSVLNPGDNSQIGASSSSDGYTGSQVAGIGIQINSGQTYSAPIYLSANILGVDNSAHTISFSAYNHTGETHNFDYGTGFIGSGGQVLEVIESKSVNDLKNNYGYGNLTRTIPTKAAYANTTRIIAPISREKGTATWYAGVNTSFCYVLAEYDANGVPFLTLHPAANLQISDLSVPTGRYVNSKQSVKVLVRNSGDEFYGTLYFFASPDQDKGTAVAKISLTALQNSSQDVSFEWTPALTGTYNIWIASDKDGDNVLYSSSILIRDDASLAGKQLAIIAFSFDGYDRNSFQVDELTGLRTFDVYRDSLVGSVTVKNLSSEAFSDFKFRVKVEKYNESTGQYEKDNNSGYFTANYAAGATRKLTVKRGPFELGKTYRICLVTKDTYEYLDDRFVVRLRSKDDPVPPNPTALEPAAIDPSQPAAQKILRDGVLYIISRGRTYTASGQLLK